MNKLILCMLSLFFSNFAFANDGLDGSISVGFYTVWDIFMKASAEVILFVIIAYFYRKLSSK